MLHVQHDSKSRQNPRWTRAATAQEIREVEEMRRQIAEIDKRAKSDKRRIRTKLTALLHRLDAKAAYHEKRTAGIRSINERIQQEAAE